MCKEHPTRIMVPNKLEDFVWHSHMQDNEKYKKDVVQIIGRALNHTDDFKE
jgi:hypothetical protein